MRTDEEQKTAVLVAVCDVLVTKALESLGKWIVRTDRSRFKVMAGRPFNEAHMLWTADREMVGKALKGAWDVVPPLMATYADHLEPDAVIAELSEYVIELALFRRQHTVDQLARRIEELNRHASRV